eukprot:6213348-Pleurochrysis_carterae.AAC.2
MQKPVVECATAQSLSPLVLNSMPSSAFYAMYARTRSACASIAFVGNVSARARMPIALASPGRPHDGA